ncbi:hypothetical protein BKA58DRAFT_395958 [Alternaria rosae]|uniref:uncharacterized protein n=1 Tax=Alternaria rosae TaxID=1187941 RepID=UPI001E8CF32D|nr:uncharacterized protein BKA58DRAFT_395958 [Alternaria rosae]KAH6881553.1 hypothetical protein BKA58DRAFT_395958 [Alternaria rosae]
MSTTQGALKTAMSLYRAVASYIPLVRHREGNAPRDNGRTGSGAGGQPTVSNVELSSLHTQLLITSVQSGRSKHETMLELRSKSDSIKADIAMMKANEQNAQSTIQWKEAAIERIDRQLQHRSGKSKVQQRCLRILLRERDAAAKTKRGMQRLVKSLTKEYNENLCSFAEVVMELQDTFLLPKGKENEVIAEQHKAGCVQGEVENLVQEHEQAQIQQDGGIPEVNNVQPNNSPGTAQEIESGKSLARNQPLEASQPDIHKIVVNAACLDQQAEAQSINIAVDDNDTTLNPPVEDRGSSPSSKTNDSAIHVEDPQEVQDMARSEAGVDIGGRTVDEVQSVGIGQEAGETLPHEDSYAKGYKEQWDKIEQAIKKLERCEKSYWERKEKFEQHYKTFDEKLDKFCSINSRMSRADAEQRFGRHFLEVGGNFRYSLGVAERSLKKARIEAKEAGVHDCNSWDQESGFLSVTGEGPDLEDNGYMSDSRDREVVMEWLQMSYGPGIMQPSEFNFATSKVSVDPWESHSTRGDSSKRRKIDKNVGTWEVQSSKAYSSKRRKIEGDVRWVAPNDSNDIAYGTDKEDRGNQKQSEGPRKRPRARSEVAHKRRARSSNALPGYEVIKGMFSEMPVEDHSVWMKRDYREDVIMVDDETTDDDT